MPSVFEIKFDNNYDGIFYAGQTVSGQVELTTNKRKIIRGIHVSLLGFTKTCWTTGERIRHPEKPIWKYLYNKAEEEYLNFKSYVIGQENGIPAEIKPGLHNFPFSFKLPENIPSSFSGEHGHINYEIILTIERFEGYPNIYKRSFTVIKELNLNSDAKYKERIEKEAERKNRCCCCFTWSICKLGGIRVKLATPFTGYVCGQNIPFELAFELEGRPDIDGFIIRLSQVTTFTANKSPPESKTHKKGKDGMPRPIKKTTNIVDKRIVLEGLEKNASKIFKEFLHIPPVPPSTVNVSKFINVEYKLEVKTSNMFASPLFEIPITIGTVPLKEFPAADDEELRHEIAPKMGLMFVDKEGVNVHRKKYYKPKYPVYRRKSPVKGDSKAPADVIINNNNEESAAERLLESTSIENNKM